MVSREGYRLLEESDESSTVDSISIPGSWSESESEAEDLWLTESCAAVLEPSLDETRYPDGKLRDFEDFFTLSCPEMATDEVSKRTNGKSTNHEDAQQSNSERHNRNQQQSSKECHKSDEQQSTSERHQSKKQQSSNEYHNNDEQQGSRECGNSNEQQNINEQHNSNQQQNSKEQHNSNEQQDSNGQHNINEQHKSNQQQNSKEQQDSNEQHSSNEQQNVNERHNSNEQQNNGENHNSNEQQDNSDHHGNNEEPADESHGNCCASFLDCYNFNSRKIKNSWFIYIFQLFVTLLSVSEIVMGIIFYGSCDPQPSPIPIVAILMGVSSLALVCNWLVKVRSHRKGEYYWNLERNILFVFLAIFLFLLILEVAFFIQASSKTVQSKVEVKCIKAYYDYLHCMFFAIGGSLVFAASLYLPDCCIYTFSYQAPVPSNTNGHYEPL